MEARRWRPVDLARASGVTLNQVVLVMKLQRRAGDRFLRGVASAFNMPQETVFRLAGMLNDQPPNRVKDDELTRKVRSLIEKIEPVERERPSTCLSSMRVTTPRLQAGQKGLTAR
jgi:hypothetical protein